MTKLFSVALGILTAIGGFLDIGDLVTNAVVGSRFGLALAWVVVVGIIGICLYAEMAGRVAVVSGRATFEIIRADEQHYRSLADRVLAGLRQGVRIVLVTGDPPVNLSSLAAALTEATAGKHTVLAIACGGEFNEQELRCAAGPSPLFLFHQAERLLDGQLAKCLYAPPASPEQRCRRLCRG